MPKASRKIDLHNRCSSHPAIVVFFDIVGFTKRNEHKQMELILSFVDGLRKICSNPGRMFASIKQCPPDTLFSPTGDGVAVAFWGEHIVPKKAEKALELVERVMDWSYDHGVRVRCGLHSGALLIYEDINNSVSFCGEPINVAKRIMDLGDDHILCSNTAFNQHLEDALRNRKWTYDNEFTIYHVKHSERVYVRNLFKRKKNREYGNRKPPSHYLSGRFEFEPQFSMVQSDIINARNMDCVAITATKLLRKMASYIRNDEFVKQIKWKRLSFYLPSKDLLPHIVEQTHLATRKKQYAESYRILKELDRRSKGRWNLRLYTLDFLPRIGLLGCDYANQGRGKLRVVFYLAGKDADKSPTADFQHPGRAFLNGSDYEIFCKQLEFIHNKGKRTAIK